MLNFGELRVLRGSPKNFLTAFQVKSYFFLYLTKLKILISDVENTLTPKNK